jgi:hypothetical protein
MTALRAELRKLRFTRSLWAIPAVGALVSITGSGVVIALLDERELAARLSEHGPLRFGPTNVGLVLLLFGIRLFADETHHHTLGSTYIAVPDRRSVLIAKALVAAGVAVGLCIGVFALVVPITIVGVAARDLPMTIDLAATAGLLARTAAAMTLVSLLGVALAAIVRNRALALVACLAWVALAEDLIGAAFKIPKLLPGSAARAFVAGTGGPDALGPLAAALVLLAFTVVAAAVAVARLRSDVA